MVGSNQPIYTSTPPFEIIVEYYKNGEIQIFEYNTANQIIDINFNLEKGELPIDVNPIDSNVTITIEVDGIADSVLYTTAAVGDTLTTGTIYTYTEKIGTEVAISSSDLQSYIISKIIVTSVNGQSEEILPSVESPVGSILNNTIRNSSVFLRFEANGNTKISITTAEAPTTKILPSIEFSNTPIKFINNLNIYLEKNIDIFLEMNEDEVIDY